LSEHPDVKEKVGEHLAPKPSADVKPRRHSFNGMASEDVSAKTAVASSNSAAPQKRGFFGKLKDKAIGTKEEREAEKLQWMKVSRIPPLLPRL
jgi:hypothetical protein